MVCGRERNGNNEWLHVERWGCGSSQPAELVVHAEIGSSQAAPLVVHAKSRHGVYADLDARRKYRREWMRRKRNGDH